MKTTILIIITVLLFAAPVFGGEYIIRSQMIDIQPGDGIMEAGSPINPYLIIDSDTDREVGTVSTDMIDLNPGDGFMEPGSTLNPYRIRTND